MNDLLSKRNIKDSVFTSLFRDNRYVFELYQALFPEDKKATIDDIETITLEYDLVNEYYNDLGFLVDDKLIVLVEAQSEWSDNIIIRVLLYLAQTWKNYIDNHDDLDLHSTRKVILPKPELFVIYTGDKKDVKDVITYSGEFLGGEESNIDVRIRVIRDGKKGDIINQYVRFTKVLTEQVKQYGRTREAVKETIDICKNQDVLKEYLQNREEEVVSIMIALYDFNSSLDKKIKQERFYARNEGMEAGMEVGMKAGMKAGMSAGMKAGKAEGQETQAKKTAQNLYNMGINIENIAKGVGYTVDVVKSWLGILPV